MSQQIPCISDNYTDYNPKKTSLVKLYPKKASKEKVLTLISELIDKKTDTFTKAWDGSIEPMLGFADCIIDKGNCFVIALNIYEQELFPGFPDDKEIQGAIAENIEANIDIVGQQTKDLAKLGFSDEEVKDMVVPLAVDEESCREELRALRIEESTEAFLNNLLQMKGITKGSIVLRTHHVESNEQINGEGTHSDGAYFCYAEDTSS